MKNWTVITGGAGYIGSHIAAAIKERDTDSVLIIDPLSKKRPNATEYCDTFADEDFSSQLVHQTIMTLKPTTVIHCAEDINESLSVSDPLTVWENNAIKTVALLKTCSFAKVKNFLFMSSASVYPGGKVPHSESDKTWPMNCSARNKLMIEQMLKDCYYSHGLNSMSFRLPIVSGSNLEKNLGPLPSTNNVIHNLLSKILIGQPFEVYGNDFPTSDGTALRNFIHVKDVVEAVLMSLNWLKTNNGCHTLNLSSDINLTVEQLVKSVERIIEREIDYLYAGREPGKPSVLTLDNSTIKSLFNWHPRYSIDDIVQSTWTWYQTGTYAELSGLLT